MSMFNVFRKEIEWEGRTLRLETGKVARQADSAVMVTYGGTTVLCAAVGAKQPFAGDFFPLTIHYIEKGYAAGKIPGGFFKREAKPSDSETLTARLIDRPIRPLFPEGFRHEVQVICTVLSHDMENPSDIPALIGTSAALTLSGMPFMGPVGATRVARLDGDLVINPTLEQMEESDMELMVAGTKEGVLMVESEAQELSEEEMLTAVMKGHESFQPVIDAIIELAETCAKDPWDLPERDEKAEKSLRKAIEKAAEKDLRAAYGETDKQTRSNMLNETRSKVMEEFTAKAEKDDSIDLSRVGYHMKKLESDIVRGDMLKTEKRIDGRKPADVRQIQGEVGILPRSHGSALFTRGETQALCVATLGTGQDEQMIDALTGEYRENFMLHYNFPSYSVGETGRMAPPGRREIGHGKLAWRAMKPMMPSKDEFPYTIRIVSEITESNGSSSMATVCGTSLAMMDAGVPLKKPVAGIAMGLIKEDKDFTVLSDIMGDEDHLGDMDFKVAGTKDGITSLQMDIKITSITEDIMKTALSQAKDGRLHILGEMDKALTEARDTVAETAPRITTLKIPVDKIRDVIGTGGKVIREIVEVTGVKMDIEDDGTVKIASTSEESSQQAIDWVKGLTSEPEQGEIYKGKVAKVVDFGAFVDFMRGKSGLVHISEMKYERVAKTTDVCDEGDEVFVKMIGSDHRGKIKLSMKGIDQKTGEEVGEDGDSNGDDGSAEAV